MSLFQYYKDRAGEWRWRLRANNNEIIVASGEGYVKRTDCIHGLELVQKLSQEADLKESDN
jgi:uncharacterized protein YegP (UPF0339 family)